MCRPRGSWFFVLIKANGTKVSIKLRELRTSLVPFHSDLVQRNVEFFLFLFFLSFASNRSLLRILMGFCLRLARYPGILLTQQRREAMERERRRGNEMVKDGERREWWEKGGRLR